ncbi:SWIB/MDM2 domain-containing protein [Hydrogenophaga sp. 2FB]|uniref:SWIB/MDM2 domain-containing protein n=1 Tax=Hydrogenophaga sp. 2FB TaxID=2502187 RepID=UPI003398C903
MIGAKPLPRTEVVKLMREYIKANKLQNSASKRNNLGRRQGQGCVRQRRSHHVRDGWIGGKPWLRLAPMPLWCRSPSRAIELRRKKRPVTLSKDRPEC